LENLIRRLEKIDFNIDNDILDYFPPDEITPQCIKDQDDFETALLQLYI
jgi:hypothetical protein